MRTSIGPIWLIAVSTARSHSAGIAISASIVQACRPKARISPAVASSVACVRPVRMMSAPTSASASAIERPRPRLPPVTRARLPSWRKRSSTPMALPPSLMLLSETDAKGASPPSRRRLRSLSARPRRRQVTPRTGGSQMVGHVVFQVYAYRWAVFGRHRRSPWQSYPKPKATSVAVTYNHDSPDPDAGWHWANGMRTCHFDCDNPESPGSEYTCGA